MGARSNTDHVGILNVNKPPGVTSHDVVVAVRKMAQQRRVGHAGTLDPLATGVLLVCLGQATRVAEYLMRSEKTYRATVRLGVSTTTHDAQGEITGEADVNVGHADIVAALQGLVGHIRQVPPKYSAIKRNGKRMYELARQGIDVEVPARWVDVYELEILAWASPLVELYVRCGPGTYIRALARDLGKAVGCGASLTGLCRLSSGSFTVSEAVSMEQLAASFAAGTLAQVLYPLDAALSHFPALKVDYEAAERLSVGQQVSVEHEMSGEEMVRVYAPGGLFVALVYRDERNGTWRARKVFAQPQDIAAAQSTSVPHVCADE